MSRESFSFIKHCYYCYCILVVLVKLSLLAKRLARKTPLRKPNRGEGIISIKPWPKRAYDFVVLLYSFVVLLHDICIFDIFYGGLRLRKCTAAYIAAASGSRKRYWEASVMLV